MGTHRITVSILLSNNQVIFLKTAVLNGRERPCAAARYHDHGRRIRHGLATGIGMSHLSLGVA